MHKRSCCTYFLQKNTFASHARPRSAFSFTSVAQGMIRGSATTHRESKAYYSGKRMRQRHHSKLLSVDPLTVELNFRLGRTFLVS